MQLPFPTALTAALRDRLALAELIIFAVLGLTHVPTHHAPVALVFWCALGVASARRDRGGIAGRPPTRSGEARDSVKTWGIAAIPGKGETWRMNASMGRDRWGRWGRWLVRSAAALLLAGCSSSSDRNASNSRDAALTDGSTGSDASGPSGADASVQDAATLDGSAPGTYTIGGTISGLSAAGLVLEDNGGDDLSVAAGATTFTFATSLADGAAYAVSVRSQPTGLACMVTGGSGRIAGASVTTVAVACTPHVRGWTWMGGSKSGGGTGAYGTRGVTDPDNYPGAREDAATWVDLQGTFWLFGGVGLVTGTTITHLGDLWKFDGARWTWVAGSSGPNPPASYGTLGVAAPGNDPGNRYSTQRWLDGQGALWFLGGVDSAQARYNDLWKFDGTSWTWVGGANSTGAMGVYHTRGVAEAGNVPGTHNSGVSWIDRSGNFWLFGGYGRDVAGNSELLGDLWKFDGHNWAWVAGSSLAGSRADYGTKGVAASTNRPPARDEAVGWIDGNNNLWLFGGYTRSGDLNDLWKFDGTNWTWMGGSNRPDAVGVYGTKGSPSLNSSPGAREAAVGWIDASGNFWLFGGFGRSKDDTATLLNDLWKFDGTSWTWVSGSDSGGAVGVYGALTVSSTTSVPGARSATAVWVDAHGAFWLFGGSGNGATAGETYLDDLWRYEP